MDKPADPATPFREVYQAFFDDLASEGTKPATTARYRHKIVRFENCLDENGHQARRADQPARPVRRWQVAGRRVAMAVCRDAVGRGAGVGHWPQR